MNFEIHSRRQPDDALIRYIHIVNQPTLNNVVASWYKQKKNLPVSDRTDAYNILAYAKDL